MVGGVSATNRIPGDAVARMKNSFPVLPRSTFCRVPQKADIMPNKNRPRIRRRPLLCLAFLLLAVGPAFAAEDDIPPELLALQYVLEAREAVKDAETADHAKAVASLEKALALPDADIAPEVRVLYARSLLEVERFDDAYREATAYLNDPERSDEHAGDLITEALLIRSASTAGKEKARVEAEEKRRLEEEKRLAEEKRREEERRQAEERRREEERRLAEERRREEERRIAEEKRLAEEKKRQEVDRQIAEEKRQLARSIGSATINTAYVENVNAVQHGSSGILIHIEFDVEHRQGRQIDVRLLFYERNGNKTTLGDHGSGWWCNYHTPDNQLCATGQATPSYESSSYNDYHLFLPCSLLKSGAVDKKFKVQITSSGNVIGESGLYDMQFTHNHQGH